MNASPSPPTNSPLPDSLPARLDWWRISRPRFWVYLFGPYIVGLLIGAHHLADLRDWRVYLFGAFFLFPANLFIYGINDINDYETDVLNRKKDGYETLVTPPSQTHLARGIGCWCAPFALIALVATNAGAVGALLGFVFFGHQYSAPPLRAKARPIWDSAFNVLYIFPAFFAYFLSGGQNFAPHLVLAAWCWTMAMHAYSAVPDIDADRRAGLNTIATRFGFQSTLRLCLGLYEASALLAWRELGALSVALSALYGAMMLFSLRARSSEALMPIYKLFPLLNTVAGFCLFWWIALHKFAKAF